MSAWEEGEKSSSSRSKELFRKAIEAAHENGDPWAECKIHELQAELVRRHRYDPQADRWDVDESVVKIEGEAFARGAMRECFRMKKLSQQPRKGVHALQWKRSNNYVAKRYIGETSGGKTEAMNDVRLQMTAGLLAEAFCRLKPPKQVVIIDCCCLEFFEREPPCFFFCERYIDGRDAYGNDFVKHNSNGGFIDDQERRLTPQLFSAASFYLSHGRVLVCDIQGVADLYTDPCMHSAGQTFGQADLGRRGMALFFQSYPTPDLFRAIGIPPFRLSVAETRRASLDHNPKHFRRSLSSIEAARTLSRRARRRSSQTTLLPLSSSDIILKKSENEASKEDEALVRLALDAAAAEAVAVAARIARSSFYLPLPAASRRTTSQEAELENEFSMIRTYSSPRKPQVPNAERDKELRLSLAEVHAALAELETEGRFTQNEPDEYSALFHLAIAAHLGSPIAAHALARFHSGLHPGALAPPGLTPHLAQPQCAGSFYALAAFRADAAAAAVIGLHFRELLGPHFAHFGRSCLQQAIQATYSDETFSPENSLHRAFAVHDLVQADYAAEGFYYECRILTAHDDGTFDLHYIEDDETELHVPAARIRTVKDHNNEQDTTIIKAGGHGGELPPRHILLAALAEHHVQDKDLDTAAALLKQAAENALHNAPALSSKYLAQAVELEAT